MVLICHIPKLILYLNSYYGSDRASGLTGVGVVTNPGPFTIKTAVHAWQYQDHPRYGDSAGMQCKNNALISTVLFVIKEKW